MAKISACVIAKNEAGNITRCLQSMQDIVDEMIVVDTGSTDDTTKIAEQLGAKVFHYKWNNDFAAARNYALEQAKGDWIIFLDADEYIVPEKIKNVRPFIEKLHGNRKIESVVCRMENTEGVGGPLRSSNPTVRIFRNSRAIRYEGTVHECIYKRGKPTQSVMDDKQLVVICHTGYTQKTIPEKLLRNTALLEEDLANGIVRNLTYHYLSDAYWRLGQYEKAVEFAHKALKKMGQSNTLFAYKPYVILMASMPKLKTYSEEAIEAICEEAIERFSHHPEIWFYRGLYYLSIGRYQLALTSLLKSLKTNECYNDLNLNNDFYALTPIAYLNIAKLYDMMNQSAKALDYYVRALQHDKFNQEAFHGLISLIRKQNAADIVYFLNNFYHIADEADVGFLVLHLSRLKVKKVLDYYHKVWFERFGHKEYVGMVLLIHGQFEQAFQIFAASFQESGDCGAELLAVISLLIGGDPGWLNSLGSKMKASFKKIISVFFQSEEDVQLFAEDFPSYCDLVNDFTYLCSQKQLDMFLHVGKRFLSDEAPARIGDILLKQGLFRYALDLYLYQIDKACSVTNPPGLFYCKAGFSCYKLKDFAGAATYFSQALAFGYRENDIFEFLEWSYQQCADEVIKEKFRMLKVSYGKISNSEKRLPISCS